MGGFLGSESKATSANRAADALAIDMFTHLNVDVAPDKLAAWIRQRWHIINPCAHAIHDAAPEPQFFNEVELGASHGGR